MPPHRGEWSGGGIGRATYLAWGKAGGWLPEQLVVLDHGLRNLAQRVCQPVEVEGRSRFQHGAGVSA